MSMQTEVIISVFCGGQAVDVVHAGIISGGCKKRFVIGLK